MERICSHLKLPQFIRHKLLEKALKYKFLNTIVTMASATIHCIIREQEDKIRTNSTITIICSRGEPPVYPVNPDPTNGDIQENEDDAITCI